jgi:hypothetical protein
MATPVTELNKAVHSLYVNAVESFCDFLRKANGSSPAALTDQLSIHECQIESYVNSMNLVYAYSVVNGTEDWCDLSYEYMISAQYPSIYLPPLFQTMNVILRDPPRSLRWNPVTVHLNFILDYKNTLKMISGYESSHDRLFEFLPKEDDLPY